MKKHALSALVHLIGNSVGLLLAVLLLPGFSIDFGAFIIVVLLFTVVEVAALPLLRKLSEKNIPQLMGGISLATTFVGLMVTNLLVPRFTIGGISNLLASTLLVWLGALIAGVLLTHYVFPSLKASATK
ncbi:phage holin family protein [Falsiphaeobacter marinintestinus]|uniref:phage holin family protein n=1 Tax=Falsiphaeobacter marinintestinus TaxID=1492905 RepID=UPI0011B52059|nr:phage holin family protein [Phaeobacter marinintestinus]